MSSLYTTACSCSIPPKKSAPPPHPFETCTPTSSSISFSSPLWCNRSRSSAPPMDRDPMIMFGNVEWAVRRARSAFSETTSAGHGGSWAVSVFRADAVQDRQTHVGDLPRRSEPKGTSPSRRVALSRASSVCLRRASQPRGEGRVRKDPALAYGQVVLLKTTTGTLRTIRSSCNSSALLVATPVSIAA